MCLQVDQRCSKILRQRRKCFRYICRNEGPVRKSSYVGRYTNNDIGCSWNICICSLDCEICEKTIHVAHLFHVSLGWLWTPRGWHRRYCTPTRYHWRRSKWHINFQLWFGGSPNRTRIDRSMMGRWCFRIGLWSLGRQSYHSWLF